MTGSIEIIIHGEAQKIMFQISTLYLMKLNSETLNNNALIIYYTATQQFTAGGRIKTLNVQNSFNKNWSRIDCFISHMFFHGEGVFNYLDGGIWPYWYDFLINFMKLCICLRKYELYLYLNAIIIFILIGSGEPKEEHVFYLIQVTHTSPFSWHVCNNVKNSRIEEFKMVH